MGLLLDVRTPIWDVCQRSRNIGTIDRGGDDFGTIIRVGDIGTIVRGEDIGNIFRGGDIGTIVTGRGYWENSQRSGAIA